MPFISLLRMNMFSRMLRLLGRNGLLSPNFACLGNFFFLFGSRIHSEVKTFSNADVSATTMQSSLGYNWDLKMTTEKLIRLF